MGSQPTYYGYIVMTRIRPEASDTVVRMFQEQTAPLIAASPGLLALLGLFHRPSGRGLSIRIWDTAANRAHSDIPSAAIADDLARYADLMRGIFIRDPYNVTIYTLPPADPVQPTAPAVARVTTEEFHSDRWDEGVAALRAVAMDHRVDPGGRSGFVLFENHGMCRAVLIEVAQTPRELDTTVGRLQAHDGAARRSGYLAKRVEREVYEVIARY